ncbi:MAG: Hsp20/alpha crystallin family protein [Vicinamibacterales bacterium]
MPCDPLKDLLAWQQRLERLAVNQQTSIWAPAVDVYETADRYVVTAELPGLTRDQVEVALQDNRLTIRGTRPAAVPERSTRHFHQVERGHGSFDRVFEFAEDIDAAHINADLRDGVLTVTLPKRPAPAPRRIEVG